MTNGEKVLRAIRTQKRGTARTLSRATKLPTTTVLNCLVYLKHERIVTSYIKRGCKVKQVFEYREPNCKQLILF